jgi:alpha-1,3-rhamnosyltransferase
VSAAARAKRWEYVLAENEDRPLVTYIVASYNHERFVAAAVESIVNQDYAPIELIVVDDGSSDGSIDILRSLREKHGFKLIEKPNGGICSVVNHAVPLARGEHIVIHASDDVSHPGRTAAQVAILEANPEAGFTVGAIRKVDEDGRVLSGWPAPSRKTYTFDDFRNGRGGAIAVSCMYRGSAIRMALPLDETISFEDVQLYWKVTSSGNTCLIDKNVRSVDYRVILKSLGRNNKESLNQDFIRFIRSYKDEVWFKEVEKRAKSKLIIQIAKNKRNYFFKYLIDNMRNLYIISIIKSLVIYTIPGNISIIFQKKY